MRMKSYEPGPQHKALKDGLDALMRKHGEKLSDQEILALMSQFVGMLIALQDQRILTPSQAMEIVASNIEIGNRLVIEDLMRGKGGSA